MKAKLVTLTLSAALIAPLAFAQTNVLSRNAVGYVKKTVERGKLELLRYDFLDIDGAITTVSNVLDAASLPADETKVFVWNTAAQQFDIENLLGAAKLNPIRWAPNTNPIVPGVAFFLEIEDGAPETDYTVYMMGEVPGANNNSETTTVDVVPGFTMSGVPYPVDADWTNLALAASATVGDRLLTWNSGTGQYDILNYLEAAKLNPDRWSGTTTIVPGQGFFYDSKAAGVVQWDAVKPYAWP